MRGRLWTLVFIAYVALDLSSPFVPGAFAFNPDECIEAARFQELEPVRSRGVGERRVVVLPDVGVHVRRMAERASMPDRRLGWHSRFAVAHATPPSSSAAPSATDDH